MSIALTLINITNKFTLILELTAKIDSVVRKFVMFYLR